jgi:hypothetical protein
MESTAKLAIDARIGVEAADASARIEARAGVEHPDAPVDFTLLGALRERSIERSVALPSSETRSDRARKLVKKSLDSSCFSCSRQSFGPY